MDSPIQSSVGLENLFGMEASKDLTLVSGDGTEFKCHRLIFIEAHSDVLAAMVSPLHGMKEAQTGRVEMIENTANGLLILIKYLYGMEVATDDGILSSDVAVELLKTAEKYELQPLKDGLVEMLLAKGDHWFDPDDLLDLYFFVKNVNGLDNLKDYSLDVMLRLRQDIRACRRLKGLKATDRDGMEELLWALVDAGANA